jgi:hypothetical protein
MFEIAIHQTRRIALVRFEGEVTEQDLAALDNLASQQSGNTDFDTVIDLTRVTGSTLTTDLISRRGELPRAFKDRERIYVVQHPDLKLLIRLYIAYQEAKGWKAPVLADSLDEALERLQARPNEFMPVVLSTRPN